MKSASSLEQLLILLLPTSLVALGACNFDLGKVFDRPDPKVEEARKRLDESYTRPDADLRTARLNLEEILSFRCQGDGGRDLVLDRPGAAYDLGLVLFRVSELIGKRFGEEDTNQDQSDAADPQVNEQVMAQRARELDCTQLLLLRLLNDNNIPKHLTLRAKYLLGNFAFLAKRYQLAVDFYDRALTHYAARGEEKNHADAGSPQDDDAVARAAAWNRAIALKRIEDNQPDASPDTPDSQQDSQQDSPKDQGNDGANDSNDASSDSNDGANDSNDSGDSASDGANDGSNDANDSGDGASNNGNDGGNDSGKDGGSNDGNSPPNQDDRDAQAPPSPSTSAQPPPPAPSSSGADLRELERFDKRPPLDLDLDPKLRLRKIPKAQDK